MKHWILLGLVAASVFLAGCGAGSDATATPEDKENLERLGREGLVPPGTEGSGSGQPPGGATGEAGTEGMVNAPVGGA